MAMLLNLQITAEKIALEIPEQALSVQLSNTVAYDPQRYTLLSYGKPDSEIKAQLGTDWQAFLQQTSFTRIFDPNAAGPIFDYQVLELILQKARLKLYPNRFLAALSLFHKPVEISAHIQDYEKLSLGRRRELEYYLQDFQRAERLSINGKELTISPAWRVTQKWLGLILRILVPIVLLFIGFLMVFNQRGQDIEQFLWAALLWLASALLVYFFGTLFWLVVFRNHLPHGYLRYQLRNTGPLLRRPTRWLADRIL